MAVESDTAEAPAHWASAAINGDLSSFDAGSAKDAERETRDFEAWISALAVDGWYVVGCAENTYISRYKGLQTEMLTYHLLRNTP